MALDPTAVQILDAMGAAMPPIETMSPTEAREASQKLAALLAKEVPRSRVEERFITVADGRVRTRFYWPDVEGPLPAFVYIHGGGWVIGGEIEMFDPLCDRLATELGCLVLSIDYRLAPEHPFPTPIEDCHAVAAWLAAEADGLGVDRRRVAVGGDSSGGNLAAALALMSRDRGLPELCFQLLVYPPTRFVLTADGYCHSLDVAALTSVGMAWYWRQYLASGDDGTNPYASPGLASDLSGLPPALVITAEFDVLRDEGRAYAQQLQAANVPAVNSHYEDMFHGFFSFSGMLRQADRAVAEAIAALRLAFASG